MAGCEYARFGSCFRACNDEIRNECAQRFSERVMNSVGMEVPFDGFDYQDGIDAMDDLLAQGITALPDRRVLTQVNAARDESEFGY